MDEGTQMSDFCSHGYQSCLQARRVVATVWVPKTLFFVLCVREKDIQHGRLPAYPVLDLIPNLINITNNCPIFAITNIQYLPLDTT